MYHFQSKIKAVPDVFSSRLPFGLEDWNFHSQDLSGGTAVSVLAEKVSTGAILLVPVASAAEAGCV